MDEKQKEHDAKFLRTLLRSDVYDKLECYAKSLSTGYDKWDFGVAIERLLDSVELFDRLHSLELRMNDVEFELDNSDNSNTEVQVSKVEKKDDDEIKLLGPHHKKVKIEDLDEVKQHEN